MATGSRRLVHHCSTRWRGTRTVVMTILLQTTIIGMMELLWLVLKHSMCQSQLQLQCYLTHSRHLSHIIPCPLLPNPPYNASSLLAM